MSLMVVTTAIAVAQASAATSTMLFGRQSVANYQDSNAAGTAHAFQYTATASGTTHDMEFYVDSGSTATTLSLGIYADSGGKPAGLVASGGLTSPTTGMWNDVPLTGASITSGQKYRIALLGTGGDAGLSRHVERQRTELRQLQVRPGVPAVELHARQAIRGESPAHTGPETVTGNRFSRLFFTTCGQFGADAHFPSGSNVTWSGNVWDDTNQSVGG